MKRRVPMQVMLIGSVGAPAFAADPAAGNAGNAEPGRSGELRQLPPGRQTHSPAAPGSSSGSQAAMARASTGGQLDMLIWGSAHAIPV